jgi:hypothetical protein
MEAWTPVRASLARPLAVNDLVRVSVEAPLTGYLYIINGELRRDGRVGRIKLYAGNRMNTSSGYCTQFTVTAPLTID